MIQPQQWMMRRHLEWLTDGAAGLGRIEIAWGLPENGPSRARTFDCEDICGASSYAMSANSEGSNVYVGVTLKAHESPLTGRTKNVHAALATCMAFDFDTRAIPGSRALHHMLRAGLLVVTGREPELRVQWWVRLRPTRDLKRWDEQVRRCAQSCEADISAVGVNRLARLAGTVSFPSAAKRARGYKTEATWLTARAYYRYTLDEIELALPPAPPTLVPTSRSARTSVSVPLNECNVRIVQSALRALPIRFAEDYSHWLQIGFALHDFDAGVVGLALWRKFSAQCPTKYAATDFQRLWGRFDSRSGSAAIGIGSLLHHAQQAGWHSPSPWSRVGEMAK